MCEPVFKNNFIKNCYLLRDLLMVNIPPMEVDIEPGAGKTWGCTFWDLNH